ncbi:MAG: exodeoxyribonuclease VII large subunit, partial [Gammaproteobacteria bacterium]
LKRKLHDEGLFDPAGKQALPALPRRVGVITSPTGAALRDVLSVLRRRFPAIPVLVYPVPVQGSDAGRDIAAMLHAASRRNECDVLILTRGGGSLEDLQAFNEEIVARAIHACRLPVISAVGHEVDFTIADFVADARAPTPSAAAELASPDQADWLTRVGILHTRAARHMRQQLDTRHQHLGWLEQRLARCHPGAALRRHAQRLDELENRGRLAIRSYFNNLRSSLHALHAALQQQTPRHRIHRTELQRQALAARLQVATTALLAARQRRLALACKALDTVSPLATLERGYAIVSRAGEREILRQAAAVRPGERIAARLAQGTLLCTVDETSTE